MRIRVTCLMVGLLFCSLALPAAAQASKVGFVDLSKALELTDMGRKIQKDLASKQDEIEIKVKSMELNLLNMKDDYNKKRDGLSEEALQEKQRAMQEAGMQYQQYVQNASMEFEKFKLGLLKGFIDKMQEHTNKIAASEGFDMVILKVEDFLTGSSVILYGSKDADLTDRVIKLLNESGAAQ